MLKEVNNRKQITCCLGCETRKPYCHDHCTEYLDQKEQAAKRSKQFYEEFGRYETAYNFGNRF